MNVIFLKIWLCHQIFRLNLSPRGGFHVLPLCDSEARGAVLRCGLLFLSEKLDFAFKLYDT